MTDVEDSKMTSDCKACWMPIDNGRLRSIIDAATDAALPPVCDVTGNGTKERASIQVEIASRILSALRSRHRQIMIDRPRAACIVVVR